MKHSHPLAQPLPIEPATKLRRLSEDVSRVARALAELTTAAEPDNRSAIGEFGSAKQVPDVPHERVKAVIRARRLRSRFFSEDLFADPAWDMLLDLFQAEIAQVRVSVSSLCVGAAVPATTALRWIKTLVDAGLLVRRADPHDGRRIYIELAPTTGDAMCRYFQAREALITTGE